MNKQPIFPWYIFLLPVFYVAHAYNSYFLLVPLGVVLKYLIIYLGVGALAYGASWLFLRSRTKAGIWTAIFLLIFFFFGAFHDFLKLAGLKGFFVSYKLWLTIFIAILLYTGWALKRKLPPLQLSRYLLALAALLFFLELATGVFYILSGKSRQQNLAGNNKPVLETIGTAESLAPDIFFFVFDEYTSSVALKKYFRFDNSLLDSTLKARGFFISEKSQSNYNATPLSLGSTFGMDYFDREIENLPNDAYSLLQGSYTLKNSAVPRLLKKAGYKLVNYGVFDLADQKIKVRRALREYEEKTMYLETLWGRIQRDVFWNVLTRIPGKTENFPNPLSYIRRNQQNYHSFLGELKKEDIAPRFVVGHVLLPHRPAYFDRHGNIRPLTMADYSDKNHDSLYLDQVQYANKWIDSLSSVAAQPRKRPLVLIIEGDHGNRYAEWGRKIREKQFMNLNVYFFSDRNYSELYDSISPVNSFRVVMNKYFGTKLPLLKDSTILLSQDDRSGNVRENGRGDGLSF